MNKITKLFVLTGTAAIMLCTNAYADENVNKENAVQIQADITQPVVPISEALQEIPVRTGTVAVDVLNVRSGPSTNDNILDKLSIGSNVEIIDEIDKSGESYNWYKIKYNSGEAYVAVEYVTLNDTASNVNAASAQNTGADVAAFAKKYIGTPYQYGGETPSGFDCSGFVKYVMEHFNYSMPRSSHDQYSYGTRVEKANLAVGDLVFFKYAGSSRIGHVGIYVGDGNFIHSPKPGQSVRITTLASGYFANCYYGAIRVVK